MIKFSIITPTHNRPELLARCIDSVLSQKRNGNYNFTFEHIIINDSPNYDYSLVSNNESFMRAIVEGGIIYIKNKENKGVNYSRNTALQLVTGDYVIFLDDDDWLANDALLDIYNTLFNINKVGNSIDWLITNRVYENGKSITQDNTKNKNIGLDLKEISYIWDYMVFKRFTGDATHIIKSKIARHAHFPKHTKQGEEFYFFLQLPDKFLYKNLNTTITDGYNTGGLTDTLKSQYKNNTWHLWKEKLNIKFFTYMIYRTAKILKNKYL